MVSGPVDEDDQPAFDTSVAHQARIYDYWLGGKDSFAADRQAAEAAIAAYPGVATGAQANRQFLARAVRHLASQAGIRQFLDIGTGIPTANNTHEVAQAAAPDSRIVYVDYDRCKSGCTHTSSTQAYDYYLGGCFLRLRNARCRPAQLGGGVEGDFAGAADDEAWHVLRAAGWL